MPRKKDHGQPSRRGTPNAPMMESHDYSFISSGQHMAVRAISVIAANQRGWRRIRTTTPVTHHVRRDLAHERKW
jgi:hypothetical protein